MLGPAAALAELVACLDAALVTHPTGHALLPALAVAGINHRVSRDPHPLWEAAGARTVLFKRRAGGPAPAPTAGAAHDPPAGADPDPPVPYVLACWTAADYVAAVDAGPGLAGLAAAAAARHPGATLGVVLEGLDAHLSARERADFAAGVGPGDGGFVRARYAGAVADAAVSLPGVRLRLVPDAAAAAEHVVGLAKALASHPYKRRGDFVSDFDGDTAAARSALAAVRSLAPPAALAARALARVPGVGPAAAVAVAAEHGCLGVLMSSAAADADALRLSLAALRAGRTRVGPAAAARVVAMLTADDGEAAVE